MTIRSLALLALLAACSDSSPLPAGAACAADTDCDTGLSCLDVAQINGSTCTVVGKSCSITCQGDNLCKTQLGLDFACFAGCGSTMTCGLVANP